MFTLVKDEPDQHLYRHGSLLLIIHWNELQLQHLASITAACDQVVREHKQMTSLIIMRGAVNVDLSSDARRAGANLTNKYERYNTGQAIVVEASGFMASLARSVITGINLLARSKASQRVFQDSREATAWLCTLSAQPPAIRDSFGTLWPEIERLLVERSRSAAGQAKIAG